MIFTTENLYWLKCFSLKVRNWKPLNQQILRKHVLVPSTYLAMMIIFRGKTFISLVVYCLKVIKLIPSGKDRCSDALGTIFWTLMLPFLAFIPGIVGPYSNSDNITNATVAAEQLFSISTGFSQTVDTLMPLLTPVFLGI